MKGILLKPDMHQAIRDDRKTVTRRRDGLKEINLEPDNWQFIERVFSTGGFLFKHTSGRCRIINPRYHAGEIVYIKEAWCSISN